MDMEKPDESDCCNSGCNPCILDVYQKKLQKSSDSADNADYENCICPSVYSIFKLVDKEKHTPNSYVFKFEYSRFLHDKDNRHVEKVLRYEAGQHFLLKGKIPGSGEEFTRAYTPIPYSDKDNRSTFTILVRLYDEGKMSNYLRNLQIGQETLWRGPYNNFKINFNIKNILFVAQGTGIAPIFSVIMQMLYNDSCETFLYLFFCCQNNHEIFLRKKLYNLRAHWNFNYELFIKDAENLFPKYEEVIHQRKLAKEDITTFIHKTNDLQVVICGSEEFGTCIHNYAKDDGVPDQSIFIFK